MPDTKYVVNKSSLTNIANAIRNKNGESSDYTPAQMVQKINNLVKPSGTKSITTKNSTNVSNYKYAKVQDNNLIAANIKKGVNILGVTGSY